MNADQKQQQTSTRAAVTTFVNGLRRRLRDSGSRTSLPDELETHVRHVRPDEDLPAKFSQAAASTGVDIHPASPADWPNVVREILRKQDARSVVVRLGGDSPFGKAVEDELCRGLSEAGLTPTTATDDDTLFAADATVTGVAAAIAETGTIICPSGHDLPRGVSLIAPVHVAVVCTSQLVADLYDYFERVSGDEGLPANINLITGPSKTADIEGILVTGVHGPGHVHVVLVAP